MDSIQRSAPVRLERSGSWLIGFAFFGFACQLLLLVPGLGSSRVLIRTGAFGGSIVLLIFLVGSRRRLKSIRALASCVLGILLLEFAHPDGSFLGSIVQFALYAAILGPIFWVPRLRVTPALIQRLFVVLWAFNTASAALGVLQAYFPGSFQPALSTVISRLRSDQLDTLKIQLVSGEHVFRPMGLTDLPGGAAYGAIYSVLLSLGILQTQKVFRGARVLAAISIVLGMICLYLCQVRSAVVVLGISSLTVIGLAAMRGQVSRLLIAAGVLSVTLPLSFALAFALGGHTITDRLDTLVEGDAGSVYYKNRGHFLQATIDKLLPKYPFGAGLGRWGMSYVYFGSGKGIYVEIQWTGWLLDGGVPMILAYVALIGASSWKCLEVHLTRDRRMTALGVWPAVVLAYNVGGIALCFSYCEFIGSSGLEFWLLNAALLTAANQIREDAGTTASVPLLDAHSSA